MELRTEDLCVEVFCENPEEYISILKKYSVKVTHVPTGITAICGIERSQYKNRNICMEMIEIALTNI